MIDYDKYFTVYCPTQVSDYTTLQQKKFFILYNLYVDTYNSTRETKPIVFVAPALKLKEATPLNLRNWMSLATAKN